MRQHWKSKTISLFHHLETCPFQEQGRRRPEDPGRAVLEIQRMEPAMNGIVFFQLEKIARDQDAGIVNPWIGALLAAIGELDRRVRGVGV